jgi:hypothetical protein
MQLSDESEVMLKSYDAEAVDASAEEGEIVGTLQISFFHDEPDLRIELPPIPG